MRGRVEGLGRALLSLAVIIASGLPALADAPATLRDTGLYADFDRRTVDPANLAFAPQYPLWTDGAIKRRWMRLPPGGVIDASDPDAWLFPAGTRFWKEFAFGGRPVETRYIERLPDGQWLFAAYEWTADGREAVLAPVRGRRGAYPLTGGRAHAIPAVSDCQVCHGTGAAPILGFSLLQLSQDRDPGGLNRDPSDPDLDVADLAAAGVLVGLPPVLLAVPARIKAANPTERAALGYMHGNCGHCHNADGPLRNLGLELRHMTGAEEEPGLASTVGVDLRKPAPGQSPEARLRVAAGDPERSALLERVGSRTAALQMPPLGTELVDAPATELIRQWIAGLETEASEEQARGVSE
jgi:hypothetical protein